MWGTVLQHAKNIQLLANISIKYVLYTGELQKVKTDYLI